MKRPLNEIELRRQIEESDVSGTPEEMRKTFEKLTGAQHTHGVVGVTRGGVRCLKIGKGPELIWFHGGGYVFGSPRTHLTLAREIASHGLCVVMPYYRLAPECVWPAPLQDALAVIDASDPAAIGGDSSGGHLALCAALRRKVKSLALISPNTDRSGQSTTRNRDSDLMNDDKTDTALAEMALPGVDRFHSDKSPILGDLSTLPPMILEVASAEILLDDSLLLARQAALAGRPLTLHVAPGLFHLYQLWPDALQSGAQSLARIAQFVLENASSSAKPAP
ncbi:alpha/beta hydrolase [Halioxenophilus aromaticivorans]|uniref:alpha/beta hydrolase n=1 Tax=Halioxenophilus aromaticivorans TaxID=1306992 RepID=UPI0031E55DC3